MSAPISFSVFTDNRDMFPTREDANSFFEAIRVPSATINNYGSTKMAVGISFGVVGYSDESYIGLNISDTVYNIPSIAHVDAIKTKLTALEASHFSLINVLKAAGLMDNV